MKRTAFCDEYIFYLLFLVKGNTSKYLRARGANIFLVAAVESFFCIVDPVLQTIVNERLTRKRNDANCGDDYKYVDGRFT